MIIKAPLAPLEKVLRVAGRPPALCRVKPSLLLAAAASAFAMPATAGSPQDLKPSVSAFIASFAGALWNDDAPVCVRVEGLPGDQAAHVKARVEADARAVGVSVGRAECGRRYQVEIRFAADGEHVVHEMVRSGVVEEPAGGRRPIRAWYQLASDNGGGGPDTQAFRKLRLAIVVVDPRRTRATSLDLVSDYAAILALSEARSLDRCSVLPSLTDLFAGACPGRSAPTGLTTVDLAYLKALYAGSPEIRAKRYPSELVDHMAKLLAAAKPPVSAGAGSPSRTRLP